MRRTAKTNVEVLRPELLPHPRTKLASGRLQRVGEGIGGVVCASEHWAVKRKPTNSEIQALIVVWKLVRASREVPAAQPP